MAEVLGVVGSVVGVASFALELVESIKKLRDFSVRVANAPKNLQRTIKEIEAMSGLLSELSDTLGSTSSSPDSRSMRGCIDLCRVGVARIGAVTEELDRKMAEKRRRTSLRFAFSKDDLRDMSQELELGKSSLLLAHQTYMQARAEDIALTQRRQLEALLSGQVVVTQYARTVHEATALSPKHDLGTLGSTEANNAAYNGFTVRTPMWLQRKVWELSVARAVNAWTWSLKINLMNYRVHDKESPVARLCDDGDIAGLQRLFSVGEASPLDRFEDGENLFSKAVGHRQMALARFVFAHGADPTIRSYGGSQLTRLWFSRTYDVIWDHAAFDDAMASAIDLEILRDDLCYLHDQCNNTIDDHSHLRCLLDRFLNGRREEAAVAWHWAAVSQLAWHMVDLSRTEAPFDGAYHLGDGSGLIYHLKAIVLLHDRGIRAGPGEWSTWTAIVIVLSYCWRRGADARVSPIAYKVITLVVTAGLSPFMNSWAGHDDTALTMLLHDLLRYSMCDDEHEQGRRILGDALRQWVGLLQQAGVDLEAYGEFETCQMRIWRRDRVYSYKYQRVVAIPGMWAISTGPDPTDWHIWWQHPGDSYAGDFWDMIDHPERTMPGAWTPDVGERTDTWGTLR